MMSNLRTVLSRVTFCLLFNSFIGPAWAGEFRAGAAKVDITPEKGVSLDGPISKNGPVTGVHDRLHARALVLAEDDLRLAIVICDACMIGGDVFDHAKQIVARKGRIAREQMLLAATHTHAAPRAIHLGTNPIDDRYHERLAEQIAEAIFQAEKNLAPAQIACGSFRVPGLIACRRFLCAPGSVGPNPFGETGERIKSVAGRSTDILKPAGPVDPEVSLLSVQFRDGQQLALLGNFSVHYCGGYRRGIVSADYFGHFSEAIEVLLKNDRDTPVIGMMSNGTSGNTGAFQNQGRKFGRFEGMQFYGRMLAEKAVQVVSQLDHQADPELEMMQTELQLAIRRPSPQRIKWAKAILEQPSSEHPHRWSNIYAQEALHLTKFPETKNVILQAIRIGDIGITAAPCEVFAETGLAIKAESPFPKTFTIELANGYGGYLPPGKQHELGGYETWPARSSYLEVNAEQKIRTGLLDLLQSLHQ